MCDSSDASESPPDIEAHHIQPEEATHESYIGNVAQDLAVNACVNFFRLHLDDGHVRVGDGQAEDVAH